MTTGAAAFVGRVDELQRLRDAAAALARGESSLVLVEGDAGAGKTRLLAEITQPPFLQRGLSAAVCGALDYARAPYAPIRDLLLALDKRFPKILKNDPGLTAALGPVLQTKPFASPQDGAEQRRVLDAVVGALRKFTAAAPLVLAIEDVHWIDRASADVLIHVARSLATMRALLFVSFRGTDAQEDEQAQYLLGQLGRSASVTLSLAPLSRPDAFILIDDVATASISMQVRRHICDLADGNPLLLIEFTKLACENPAALHGSLPITLKALVAERLSRFTERDVDVLRVAAAMGEFDPGMLAEIAGVPVANVIATLRKARSASIVEERRVGGAPFVFRHALIRHAITEDLLAVEVADLHRRVGERLEAAGSAQTARLAFHFWHAGDRAKLQQYNERAAGEAFERFAFSDAATYYERAIDARPLSQETFDLYRRWAEACTRAHRSVDAVNITEQLFAYAAAGTDGVLIANIGFELSRRRYTLLDDDGALATITRTIALVDASAYPSAVFNLHATHGWYLAQLRRLDEGRAALMRAEPLIDRGDADALVRYYETAAAMKVHANGDPAYRADLNRALEIAHELGPAIELKRLNTAVAL
jgi:predicted ATPase